MKKKDRELVMSETKSHRYKVGAAIGGRPTACILRGSRIDADITAAVTVADMVEAQAPFATIDVVPPQISIVWWPIRCRRATADVFQYCFNG